MYPETSTSLRGRERFAETDARLDSFSTERLSEEKKETI